MTKHDETITSFEVDEEYLHRECVISGCPETVAEGDEWGEQWTTDDEDDLYCLDHNHLNPTSDNYDADAWLGHTTRI